MDTDDLDDRLRRAAEPAPEVVDRVVRGALASLAGRTESTIMLVREWRGAFATLAACLVVAVTFGVWWCVRPATPASAGVYRVESLPSDDAAQVISVTNEDGTRWILSTAPDHAWLPQGSSIVAGAGEER